jgi:mannose-6-phosphate isomerase-like protein (cupin superfamily)
VIQKVSLAQKLSSFSDHWSPKIVGTVNDTDIKVVKVKGEFVWHAHENEDELFYIVKGKLTIELRDGKVELNPGEFVVIPRGVEHRPVADEEVELVLIEKSTIDHTGGVADPRKVEVFERI